jgi:hypothetical protein
MQACKLLGDSVPPSATLALAAHPTPAAAVKLQPVDRYLARDMADQVERLFPPASIDKWLDDEEGQPSHDLIPVGDGG